jgi:hypothetical protein
MRWRWWFVGSPVGDIPSDRTHAASVTERTDLIEEELCDVLSLTPAPREVGLKRVECPYAWTIGSKQVGWHIGEHEASHRFAVELELPCNGAHGESLFEQMMNLRVAAVRAYRKSSGR